MGPRRFRIGRRRGSDVARHIGPITASATGSLRTVNIAATETRTPRVSLPHDKRAVITRVPITQSSRSNPLL
jgi:hypothetical protein